MTIAEIIARLEQGETGADLDLAIANTSMGDRVGPWVWHDRSARTVTSPRHGGGAASPVVSLEAFTTDFHDAWILAENPEPLFWRVWATGEGAYAALACRKLGDMPERAMAVAKTPALALTIAALKAREAQHD